MQSFADYVAEKKAEAAGSPAPSVERDPLDDELDALRAKAAEQEAAARMGTPSEPSVPMTAPPAAPTDTSRAITTATNRAQKSRENMRQGMRQDESSASPAALGFGAARGLTAGMVDRAVGAGATIGENLASAFNDTGPANPNAGEEARDEYLRREAIAKQAAPGSYLAGELGMGMVPTIATSGMNRFAQAAALGATFGAGNTRSNAPLDVARGAALGAGGGLLAEGSLGTLFRKGVRGAPAREDKAFMRDMTRTDAGEGAQAMLARNKEELVRDRDALRELRREDPEIRAIARMKDAEKGIPRINAKINPYAEENANLYGVLDHAAVTGDPRTRAGLMTAGRLIDSLEAAKSDVSAEGAARISGIQRDLRNHIIPRMWGGEEVIPAARLREWLTSVGDSAARVPGSLNATQASKSAKEAEKAAYRVVNDYFDSIGAPDVMKQIRANNEKISPLITIRSALAAKSKKEILQSMGLSQAAEQATRKLELGAALAAVASGHPGAAAAMIGRPYGQGIIKRTAEGANRAILDPLQRAAEVGNTGLQPARFGRAAIEGLPQMAGRTLAAPAASTLQQQFANPDYRTSTEVR